MSETINPNRNYDNSGDDDSFEPKSGNSFSVPLSDGNEIELSSQNTTVHLHEGGEFSHVEILQANGNKIFTFEGLNPDLYKSLSTAAGQVLGSDTYIYNDLPADIEDEFVRQATEAVHNAEGVPEKWVAEDSIKITRIDLDPEGNEGGVNEYTSAEILLPSGKLFRINPSNTVLLHGDNPDKDSIVSLTPTDDGKRVIGNRIPRGRGFEELANFMINNGYAVVELPPES